jgi:hypothetical protein
LWGIWIELGLEDIGTKTIIEFVPISEAGAQLGGFYSIIIVTASLLSTFILD